MGSSAGVFPILFLIRFSCTCFSSDMYVGMIYVFARRICAEFSRWNHGSVTVSYGQSTIPVRTVQQSIDQPDTSGEGHDGRTSLRVGRLL